MTNKKDSCLSLRVVPKERNNPFYFIRLPDFGEIWEKTILN
jgi:hypothetical protein